VPEKAQAAAWPADLIVLTRHPRPAMACLDLGSTPDQVMRQASRPVLAIPARQDDREHRPI
jgi:nucleotide-binding universal stress UspA family protein